jgi:hypothetical protein
MSALVNKLSAVMAGLVPAIHVLLSAVKERKTWMPAFAGMAPEQNGNC